MQSKTLNYKKELRALRIESMLIWGMIISVGFSSCKEAAPIPILGTYQGESETITWGFREILDGNGNMVGIEEIRDTVKNEAGTLMLAQVDKESAFTLAGTGSLTRINSSSNHEFSYDNQDEFVLVENTDGAETKRLELKFVGGSTVTLFYLEQRDDANMRPTGRQINFSGQAE